ncbi:MAG: DUF3276 family protein [Bacteroidota bacterium]
MPNAIYTKTVKAGKITYFFDVKEAKNQSKYLTITASQPTTEGDKKFAKRSINLFGNAAEKFQEGLQDAIKNLK